MSSDLAEIFAKYTAQRFGCPETADRSLLDEAWLLFEAEIVRGPLTPELAHLGHDLYFHLNDRPSIVYLMTSYLRQSLSVEEEAWARWELLDYTALLAYPNGEIDPEPCRRVVEMHQNLLLWAKDRLPRDRWLWVMYDGTQAVCWRLAGCGDVWLQIFEEIYPAVEPSSSNRYSRFVYLRTAAHAYLETGCHEQALRLAQEIHDLSLEDVAWEHALKMVAGACSLKIWINFKWGKLETSDATCREIVDHLNSVKGAMSEGKSEGNTAYLIQLSNAYETVGSALFFAGHYEQSIPLLERAVSLGEGLDPNLPSWTYMRLAAAAWTTTKNRKLTCDWLRRGAAVHQGDAMQLSAYPVLAEVANDSEFVAASKPYRSK